MPNLLPLAQLGQLAALAARWLPLGMAWLLVLAGTLFCISLVRSALQAVHYTVWRTDTQLGSRGGLSAGTRCGCGSAS